MKPGRPNFKALGWMHLESHLGFRTRSDRKIDVPFSVSNALSN
jgi:hypothetical protein